MEDTVTRIVEWATESRVRPMGAGLVPGTDREERRALAALGGLALALGGRRVKTWPDPLRCWAEGAPPPPARLVRAIRSEVANGVELLARLYEKAVSGRSRRRLGTFFTPRPIVSFMLDEIEAAMGTPAVVIDPGAGVGVFSVAARRRWPSARVLAVDVNVVTLGLLAARCAAEKIDGVELVLDDYLGWVSRGELPPGPVLIMGNPPYTRHQELPMRIKQQARKAAGPFVDSSLAGLSAYFLAASLRVLDDQSALCFLLPGTWVDARYGRELRSALWKARSRRVELSAFPTDAQIFPGTHVTGVVATVGPVVSTRQPLVARSVVLEVSGVRVSRTLERLRIGPAPEKLGPWLWPRPRARVSDRISLGEVARTRRGVATGANRFFFLTDRQQSALPEAATLPALRSIRQVAGHVLDTRAHDSIGERGEPRWLLWLVAEKVVNNPFVQDLIAAAESSGLHERYLTSNREPWYLVEEVAPPNVMVAAMGKRIRAVENKVMAVPSNSIYGIYLDAGGPMAEGITLWLNSREGQHALGARARRYSDGLFKLEPRDLMSVRIPKPEMIVELAHSYRETGLDKEDPIS